MNSNIQNYHMKRNLLAITAVAAVLLGCTGQQPGKTAGQTEDEAQKTEYEKLLEKARWGDGEAYVRLADCYRDGEWVEKDMASMYGMLNLFKVYGKAEWEDEYLENMPGEADLSQINLMLMFHQTDPSEKSQAAIDRMAAKGIPEVYTWQGLYTIEEGNTAEGVSLIEKAASLGGTYAELLLCFSQWEEDATPDVERLKALAERCPFACQLLGDVFSGEGGDSLKDEKMAAYYYLKADEKAFLDREQARWLLDYHKRGGDLQVPEDDLVRLQTLAGDLTDEDEANNNSNEQ